MKRNSISALAIVLGLGLVLFIGLTVSRRNTPLTNQPPIRQQRVITTNPPIVTPRPSITPKGVVAVTPQASIAPQKMLSVDRQKSDNIHKQLSKMKELNQVGVMVTGNTALVGYSPSKSVKDINSTKTLISKKVKQIDPSITNVVVSESADIMARINKLATDITKNRPASEISNEINRLLKGVTPTVK